MLTRRESKQIINFIKAEIRKNKTAFLTDGVINLSKRTVGFLSGTRVSITDSSNNYVSGTVEGALKEVAAVTSDTFDGGTDASGTYAGAASSSIAIDGGNYGHRLMDGGSY